MVIVLVTPDKFLYAQTSPLWCPGEGGCNVPQICHAETLVDVVQFPPRTECHRLTIQAIILVRKSLSGVESRHVLPVDPEIAYTLMLESCNRAEIVFVLNLLEIIVVVVVVRADENAS